jgi:chemotaxis protein CheD
VAAGSNRVLWPPLCRLQHSLPGSEFDTLGASRKEVEVKVFGGSDVLPVAEARNAKPTVGALNAQAAMEVLEAEGFKVLASDLGGNRGRKIHFHTGTGIVLVHKLGAWSDAS